MTPDPSTHRLNVSTWTYDKTGNLIRGQDQSGTWQRFEYDAAGRLVKVPNDSSFVLETYTYGVARERLINENSSGRTYYVWGGQNVIAEYTETTSGTMPNYNKAYIYAGSRLLMTATMASMTTESLAYDHPDRLGTKLITDGSGDHLQSTFPFGTSITAEGGGYINQSFTSYDRSSTTGLDYADNRTFSKGQSRFTQVDPLKMGAASVGNPQSNNLYAYTQNLPTDFVDPSGLDDEYGPTINGGTTWGAHWNWWEDLPWGRDNDGFRIAVDPYNPSTGGVGGGGGSLVPDKCPPYPDYPAIANLDGNIAKMVESYKWALSPGYAEAGDDAFAKIVGHAANFANLVRKSGDWDYKKYSNAQHNYETFGNFHFGAVAAAAGFAEGTILRAAGFIQKMFGDSPGDGGNISLLGILTNGGSAPFEDQLRDQDNIKLGISYYQHKFVRKDCK